MGLLSEEASARRPEATYLAEASSTFGAAFTGNLLISICRGLLTPLVSAETALGLAAFGNDGSFAGGDDDDAAAA